MGEHHRPSPCDLRPESQSGVFLQITPSASGALGRAIPTCSSGSHIPVKLTWTHWGLFPLSPCPHRIQIPSGELEWSLGTRSTPGMSQRILGLANSMVTSCLYPFTSLRGIFYPNGVKGKSSHSSCLSSLGKGRCRFSASLSLSHVFCLPKDAQTRMNFGRSCWGREGSWLSLQAQGRRAWSDKGTVIRGGRRKSFSLVTPWLRSAQKKKFRVFLNWITSISQNPRNKTKQISLEWELQPRISRLPADPSPQSLQAGEDREYPGLGLCTESVPRLSTLKEQKFLSVPLCKR